MKKLPAYLIPSDLQPSPCAFACVFACGGVCGWGVRGQTCHTQCFTCSKCIWTRNVQMHYLGIGRNCAPRVCFSLFVNALTSAVVTVQVPINTNISLLCLGCFCFAKAKQKQARGVRLCTAE
jgi:hypothetical protein